VNDPDHKADDINFFCDGEGAEQVQQDCCDYTALAVVFEAAVSFIG
jgi:hypothetical protein